MQLAKPAKSSCASGFTLVELPAVSLRNRAAFTLVELLVVIGIIAVLLAMLLPALNKVRRQALSIQCQSNLRQLLIAAQLYANDNNGVMPGYDSLNGLNGANCWWLTLAKYLGNPDFNYQDPNHNQVAAYQCPACDENLLAGAQEYAISPVTYAISLYASDSNPYATNPHPRRERRALAVRFCTR